MTDADDFTPPPLAPPTRRVPLYLPRPYATGPTSVQPEYPEPQIAPAAMRDPFAGADVSVDLDDDPEVQGVIARLRRMVWPR